MTKVDGTIAVKCIIERIYNQKTIFQFQDGIENVLKAMTPEIEKRVRFLLQLYAAVRARRTPAASADS